MTRKEDESGTRVARLLRKMAAWVERQDAEDIDAFLDGRLQLQFNRGHKGRTTTANAQSTPPTAILDSLAEHENRDAALGWLRTQKIPRRDLEGALRTVGLRAQRGETLDDVRDRLVEAAIGTRLRAQAIRNARV